MVKKTIAYCLFAIGFIAVSFLSRSSGTTSIPLVYWIVGIGCWVVGFILLIITYKNDPHADQKRPKKIITPLKESGEKINVRLSECEIKTNDYSEEVRITGNDAATINTMIGEDNKNVVRQDVYQSVLVYRRENFGKVETFISQIIPIEQTTLLFKLDNQKTTTIYVDPTNRSNYYFDVEFLFK